MIAPPQVIDLRPELGPVVWQGNRETCLALAATAGHEILRARDRVRLSAEYLYWAALNYVSGAVGALPMAAIADALREHGQCRDQLWPYDPDARPSITPTAAMVADASGRKVGVRPAETRTPPLDAARTAIANGLAVVLGLGLTESLYKTAADGTVLPPDDDATTGHAVLVVGYEDARRALLVRNSWGTQWGIGGYGWLPYDYPRTHVWRLLTFRL